MTSVTRKRLRKFAFMERKRFLNYLAREVIAYYTVGNSRTPTNYASTEVE